MTKDQKVDILYRMAKGKPVSAAEKRAVAKYNRGGFGHLGDSDQVTKANIKKYVTAIDNKKTHVGYEAFSLNRGLGDSRRNSGKKDMVYGKHVGYAIGAALLGVVCWTESLIYITGGGLERKTCMIVGAIVAVITCIYNRRLAVVTCVFLPLFLAFLCTALF